MGATGAHRRLRREKAVTAAREIFGMLEMDGDSAEQEFLLIINGVQEDCEKYQDPNRQWKEVAKSVLTRSAKEAIRQDAENPMHPDEVDAKFNEWLENPANKEKFEATLMMLIETKFGPQEQAQDEAPADPGGDSEDGEPGTDDKGDSNPDGDSKGADDSGADETGAAVDDESKAADEGSGDASTETDDKAEKTEKAKQHKPTARKKSTSKK